MAYLKEGMEMLPVLQDCNLVRDTPRGWIYAGRGRAVDAVSLGTLSSDTFRVMCEGKILETMEKTQAFREGHIGAVLLHRGETYLVKDLDLETKIVRVEKAEVDYHTEAIRSTELTVLGEERKFFFSDCTLSFGEVEVVEQYTGYRVVRGTSVVSLAPLHLPPIRFKTKAFWITIPDRLLDKIKESSGEVEGGLHGAEHALIGMMPFFVMCDRWDLGGLSTACHPSTGAPMIFVYDGCEGGIGLTEKACDLIAPILEATHALVRDCPCDEGCPACIFSPKCGNENHPLDKESTQILLEELSAIFKGVRSTTSTECTSCPRKTEQ
jgi:DEAD/DEAH box helicase domain-containing protein